MAPVAAFQLSAGLRATPVAPLAGALSVGAGGAGGGGGGGGAAAAVVKLNGAESPLLPPELLALTRQKYCVPAARPVMAAEVAEMPAWSMNVPENVALVETCSR